MEMLLHHRGLILFVGPWAMARLKGNVVALRSIFGKTHRKPSKTQPPTLVLWAKYRRSQKKKLSATMH